jgi:hypothetical protein
LIPAAAALSGCAKDPVAQLGDPAVRQRVMDTLAADADARRDLIDRLVGAPGPRAEVLDRVLKDEAVAGDLVQRIMAGDRGKALVVSKVTADPGGARTFIRMLMLTGVMGTMVTQTQADVIGLGDAYVYGNRKRTMTDLKRVGALIDAWSRDHDGQYPACAELAEIGTCLARKMPPRSLESLPQRDAWGRPFQYRTDRGGTEYMLLSYATDGRWDGLGRVGPTDGFDCDIVFSNGGFIQWPGAIRREDIR